MTTTYTPSLRLIQPGVGDPSVKNAWGGLENTNMGLIESAITGVSSVNVGGASTFTLTATNGAVDQSRAYALSLTGVSGTCTVTIPSVARFGLVQNASGVGTTVVLTTGSGNTLTVPGGGTGFTFYQCDGTNVVQPITFGLPRGKIVYAPTAGGTLNVNVPAGVTWVKLTAIGPGGAGGAGNGGAGGGGGAGGYGDLWVQVAPGQTLTAIVPAVGSAPGNSTIWSGVGSGLPIDAGVGQAGNPGSSTSQSGIGGAPGSCSGGNFQAAGGWGNPGFIIAGANGAAVGGAGGAAYGSNACAGVMGTLLTSLNGISADSGLGYSGGQFGGGGGGGIISGVGGTGGAGACIMEW